MARIGWGILSTGRMADWFCADFKKVTDGELVAVASRSQQAADQFGARYGIPHAYNDYRDLLTNDAVDVIYMATPHTLHFQNAADALNAGKAVVCEKPLTINAAECSELIDIARSRRIYMMEAMWTYFLPAMQKAKQWVDEGRIGTLLHVKTDFGYPVSYDPKQREYDRDLGGGCLLEMGIYPVAIAYFFAGMTPVKVMATGRFAPNGVEEDVTALFTYGDVTATLGTSFRCRLRNAAYIIGTDGYIVVPDAFRCHECFLYELDTCIDHFEASRETRGYEYQAIAVCRDLLNGQRESETVPLEASLAFQRQIDGIKAALSIPN